MAAPTRPVSPRPFDHRSRMRLIEHGATWTVEAAASPLRAGMALLRAADGYLKWWPLTHIAGESA